MNLNQAAILIPVHNRKAVTLACLERLHNDGVFAWATIIVIDDGSTDGTAEAIGAEFPAVRLQKGSGNLWWGGAMDLGMRGIRAEKFPVFFWLNDDCLPNPGTMLGLLAKVQSTKRQIAAALCLDPHTGLPSYGGGRRSGWRLVPITPSVGESLRVDWLSGNLVCFPASVLNDVGTLDHQSFPHYYGDVAYTLKCRDVGYKLSIEGELTALCKLTPNWFSILRGDETAQEIIGNYTAIRSGHYWRARLGISQLAAGPIIGLGLYCFELLCHSLLFAVRTLLPRKLLRIALIALGKGAFMKELRLHPLQCPLCGTGVLSPYLETSQWAVAVCGNCSNAITMPPPPHVDYVDEDFHADTVDPEDANFDKLPRFWKEAIQMQVKLLAQRLTPRARILEVGCGQGFLLEQFAHRGFTITGLETSVSACARVRAKGFNVIQGSFPESCPAGSFDAVVFSHVIEHIGTLHEVLENVQRIAPEGHVMFIQSNWQGLVPRVHLERWSAWMPHQHFWHFTPKGLDLILSKRGWQTVTIERSNLCHDADLPSARIARRFPKLGDQFHLISRPPKHPNSSQHLQ